MGPGLAVGGEKGGCPGVTRTQVGARTPDRTGTMGRLGLRVKLVTGALALSIIPLLIVALLVPPRVETAFLHSGEAQLQQMAQSIANSVELLLARHVEMGRGLAQTEQFATVVEARNAKQLAPEALAAANRQIGAMLKGLGDHYQCVWLSDAEGIIFSGCLKTETRPRTPTWTSATAPISRRRASRCSR